MRWTVHCELDDQGTRPFTCESDTHEEAFVRWRIATFTPKRLRYYQHRHILVSVLPVLPARFETEADFALLGITRKDFDLCEMGNLSVLAIAAQIEQERKTAQREKRRLAKRLKSCLD